MENEEQYGQRPEEQKPEGQPLQQSEHEVNEEQLIRINHAFNRMKQEIGKLIIGQEDTMELLMAALLTSGHVLLEGVPGIAKTLLAKVMAQTLSVDFSRIQFTPDLMPTDVLGTTIFNMKSSEFVFKKGPIFSNVVLIDEINRSPAKTQAALFEVMEEFQVTYDGVTYLLGAPFFVMATQNPIEQEGTYKLPEAQLDRFTFKLELHYPSLEEEVKILQRFQNDFHQKQKANVNGVFSPEDIADFKQMVEKVYIKEDLIRYIAEVINLTRNTVDLYLGASPRASLAIMKSSKALALLNGRAFVTPDDIRKVSYPVLNHRVLLNPEKEMEGVEVRDVIQEILQKVEVPR